MNTNYKKLTRRTPDRMIAGVCSGLGYYSNIDPTVIRLAAVLLLFLTGPGILAVYLIMTLIVPEVFQGQRMYLNQFRKESGAIEF